MKTVSISVEADRFDVLFFGALCKGGPDGLGRCDVPAVTYLLAQGLVSRRSLAQRNSTLIVDDLSVDVFRAAKHRQSGLLARAVQTLANALLAPPAARHSDVSVRHNTNLPNTFTTNDTTSGLGGTGQCLTLLPLDMLTLVPYSFALVGLSLA